MTSKVYTPGVAGAVPVRVPVFATVPLNAVFFRNEGRPKVENHAADVFVGVVPVAVKAKLTLADGETTMVADDVMTASVDNGVTDVVAADAALVPRAVVVVTLKVYFVPLVKPYTVHRFVPTDTPTVKTHFFPPGVAVAV